MVPNDFTKEEYAELNWKNVKAFIEELDGSDWDDRSKLYQLIGYMEAYKEQDEMLEHGYETR